MAKTQSDVWGALSLEWMLLSDALNAHDPANEKDHDIGGLIESIWANGFNDPLTLDEESGLLVEGHGRTLALDKGLRERDTLPHGIQIDDKGVVSIPVHRGLHFSGAMARGRYRMAHNKIGEDGGWHENKVLDTLRMLHDADMLDGSGYDADDIDDLSALLGEASVQISDKSKRNPAEKIDGYLNNPIKQIVLYYANQEYELVLEALDRARNAFGVESNTEAVTALLQHWEKSK